MRSFFIYRTDLLLTKEHSGEQIKQNERQVGHVVRLGDRRNACRVVRLGDK